MFDVVIRRYRSVEEFITSRYIARIIFSVGKMTPSLTCWKACLVCLFFALGSGVNSGVESDFAVESDHHLDLVDYDTSDESRYQEIVSNLSRVLYHAQDDESFPPKISCRMSS